MRAWRKKLAGVFLTVAMVFACAAGITVCAAEIETPDLNRNGFLTVTMQDPETENPVPGGKLTLYRVADVKVKKDADCYYELTADFAGSRADLTVLDANMAERLAVYAEKKKLDGKEQKADAAGRTVFSNLKPGLFLIAQKEAAEGYETISPFLVSIPLEENGKYLYEVDAAPKMELVKKPETPSDKISTPPLDKSGSPVKTGDDTRLLLWGILAAGSFLGAAATIILSKRRKEQ